MEEKERKGKNTLYIEVLLLIISMLLLGIVEQEIYITLLIVILIILTFLVEYHKKEFLLFFIGAFLGAVVEIGGNYLYKFQYSLSGSFFGIPLWMPLLWGYAFVFMRRIGNIVVKN
jgi:hypothetical protein